MALIVNTFQRCKQKWPGFLGNLIFFQKCTSTPLCEQKKEKSIPRKHGFKVFCKDVLGLLNIIKNCTSLKMFIKKVAKIFSNSLKDLNFQRSFKFFVDLWRSFKDFQPCQYF